jgi:hypothetical protein
MTKARHRSKKERNGTEQVWQQIVETKKLKGGKE